MRARSASFLRRFSAALAAFLTSRASLHIEGSVSASASASALLTVEEERSEGGGGFLDAVWVGAGAGVRLDDLVDLVDLEDREKSERVKLVWRVSEGDVASGERGFECVSEKRETAGESGSGESGDGGGWGCAWAWE